MGLHLTGVVVQETGDPLLLAHEKESNFDYLGAASIYTNVIESRVMGDVPGELLELRGQAHFRAAFQTGVDFDENLRKSLADYEHALVSYSTASRIARADRCRALVALAGFWLASNASDRQTMLDSAWQSARTAMRVFEETNDFLEFGKTFNEFAFVASLLAAYYGTLESRRKLVKDVLAAGEKAVKYLEQLSEGRQLAYALVSLAAYVEAAGGYLEMTEQKESEYKRAREYWNKAVAKSEEAAFLGLSRLFNFLVYSSVEWGDGTDDALNIWKKAIDYSTRSRDRLAIGSSLDLLAHHHFWRAHATDDPDERERLATVAVEYSENSAMHYSEIAFSSPRGGTLWCHAPRPEYYWLLARFEARTERKKDLLSKGLGESPGMLEKAQASGFPEIIWTAHHVYSKILLSLASIENDSSERRRFLEQALVHRKESIRINNSLEPYNYWNLGVLQSGLADINSEISATIKEPEGRRSVLEQAISNAQSCLDYCSRVIPLSEALGTAVGRWERLYGDLWSRLFALSNDSTHLSNAIQAYEKAVGFFQRPHQPSRAAECYWKMAIASGLMGDALGAADKFQSASDSYSLSSENYQQLKGFYREYSSYMQAWVEIENAHYFHGKQEYSRAKEHYERAAALHESTKHWGYLTSNYSAWAMIESAENSSRSEESNDAIQSFAKASHLFTEARTALTVASVETRDEEERDMAQQLAQASATREEYCKTRITVEEARILDRRGDHAGSAEKYGKASESLSKMAKSLAGPDRAEIELIQNLTRAWHTMAKAEAEASPALYLDASRLFEQAKEVARTETSKLLALGHSRFCKALELTAKYSDTATEELYRLGVQELETAAKYYLRAGSQKDSEYARASRLLLDAYSHLRNADRSKDQQEKARLYIVAENILRVSTGSLAKAGYPDKAQEVSRLLSRVSQDRELAVSLAQILSAPSIVTDTVVFPTPAPSFEKPVGLERFERGDVQGDVKLDKEGLVVGGALTVEVQLTNAGRGNVQIVSLEGVLPSGFGMIEKPTVFRMDGKDLDLRGRQLGPMKTEKVTFSIRPENEGSFQFSPIVRFIDERGEYRTLDLDSTTVVVMGSDTKHSVPIMQFLAKRFVEDYMTRRQSIETSGWCGLMEISSTLKIPKAQVYGDSRHGHTFGKPLQSMVKAGLIEYRIFEGTRGRGGKMVKVRVNYEKEPVKNLVDELALKPLGPNRSIRSAEN